MALTILNNIAALAAENQLNITSSNLNSTLEQLSSGSRINSGADDPAGLAIADGLQANVAALTQSASNATDGIGELQVADGALSQVTTLLDRAVTLATEASNSGLSSAQSTALNGEYTAIQNEIDSIGSTTNYNGSAVFGGTISVFLSDGTSTGSSTISASPGTLSSSSLLGGGGGSSAILAANNTINAGDAVTIGGTTYTFVTAAAVTAAPDGATESTPGAAAGDEDTGGAVNVALGTSTNAQTAIQQTLQNLADAVNGSTTGAGTAYQTGAGANPDAAASVSGDTVTFTSTPNGQLITAGITSTFTPAAAGTELNFINGATFSAGNSTNLLSTANAEAALAAINGAIATVAATRGTLGASVEQLQAATNVITDQTQNLTSAENNITAADIPSTVANLSQYSILEQTGISALSQANQQQQLVLKLLQ